jgi:type III pantothenate kinase
MHILVDIGNTNILFGKFDNLDLVEQLRIETNVFNKDVSSIDSETHKKINTFIKNDCVDCFISGVVPDTILSLINFIKNHQDLNIVEIDNEYLANLIKVDVDKPYEVGVDRLINSYAGLNLYNSPLIIIDFGTATTFDLVNLSGSYIGGIICPGVNLSIQSLAHNTAKLPLIEIKKVEKLIGKDTSSAIESGIYWGYVSLVGGLIDRLKKQNGFEDASIVATGGLSGMFRDDLSKIQHYEPDLTLKGLNIIYNEYKK